MIKRILKLKKDINYIKNGYRTFIEFNFKNIICNKRTTVKELNERKILTEMDLEMAKLQIEFMRKLEDEQPI